MRCPILILGFHTFFFAVSLHTFFGCPILLLGFHTFFFAVSLHTFFGCPNLLLGFHSFFAVSYHTYIFPLGVPYSLRSHFVRFSTYPTPMPTALVVFSLSPLTSFPFDYPHPHSSLPFLPLTFVRPLLCITLIKF